jgi:predicted GNAT family acetyltransferase
MEVHVSADVEPYAGAVMAFLEAQPAERNVLRTVIEAVRDGVYAAPASFWWVSTAGRVVAAAHWTPPWPLLVSSLPETAAPPLAEAVRRRARELALPVPGVSGPHAAAHALANTWTALTGEVAVEERRLLLHELSAVTEVPKPPGRMRPITVGDTELLEAWLAAFFAETRMAGADARTSSARMLQRGHAHLWEADERPVCLAGSNPNAAGVVRIGPVYTPPEQRNCGYARRLVAELSAASLALPGVYRCMLFTDMANPVSNSIYRQAGYVPGGEHVEIVFRS